MTGLLFLFLSLRACAVREEYVSLSNGLWLQNQINPTACFLLLAYCLPHLFIVHEYWRDSTSYIQIYHPLKIHIYRVLFISEPSFDGLITHFFYPSVTGRWLLVSRQLPCIIDVYDFIVRTHHLDLLSKLLAYYFVDLLLRNGWHSNFPTSTASHTTGAKVFYTFFYYYVYWGTSIFVIHVNYHFVCFLLTYFYPKSTTCYMLFIYSIQFTTLQGLYSLVPYYNHLVI